MKKIAELLEQLLIELKDIKLLLQEIRENLKGY